MSLPKTYFWSRVPVIRLLLPLIAGILIQWEWRFSFYSLALYWCSCLLLLTAYFFISEKLKFRYRWVNGLLANFFLIISAALLVWQHDIRNDEDWIGSKSADNAYLLVSLEEPLVEKSNSFKSVASIDGIYIDSSFRKCSGKVLLYFKKDSSHDLHNGSQIVIGKSLQEIRSTGNPGSFDYKGYCLFQGITHQVYLTTTDFEVLPVERKNIFNEFILKGRSWVVHTLQEFIPGEKEQGLAEALLIGYKDDLDKNLVQSYTNTGVVHIIAISGMHLALIYGLLLLLTRPIQKRKELKWFRAFLILGCLWTFTLLAGAQASVVRSAVMFTCIVFGDILERKTSIYNTLALSAFLLLVYNPFWLWDVGFQLSYAAVISIVAFYRPVYNWFYFTNKLLDFFWKTIAISVAAQILTTPISLYHFHQFPLLFLLTNILAVPLSSLILFGEIGICVLAFMHPLAKVIGNATQFLIWCMNSYIERIESISFSLWEGFSISILQTVLLIGAIVFICGWLLEKRKGMLWFSLGFSFTAISLRSLSFAESYHQKKIIVYNVPKHSAMDLIYGRRFSFIGDSSLLYDEFTRNFHIQPSRILHRINAEELIMMNSRDFEFFGKRIVIIDSTMHFQTVQQKEVIDVLVLEKNPRLYIAELLKAFSLEQVVIDGSVPQWKAKLWKKDCDSLHIPCYDVSEKGAFVMNL